MPNRTTELRLAESPSQYQELDRQIEGFVDRITHHGESSCANDLFALIELLTDTRTDANDREGLAFQALQRVFMYTAAGRLAIEEEIVRVNPRIKVPSYIKAAAVREVSNG